METDRMKKQFVTGKPLLLVFKGMSITRNQCLDGDIYTKKTRKVRQFSFDGHNPLLRAETYSSCNDRFILHFL